MAAAYPSRHSESCANGFATHYAVSLETADGLGHTTQVCATRFEVGPGGDLLLWDNSVLDAAVAAGIWRSVEPK